MSSLTSISSIMDNKSSNCLKIQQDETISDSFICCVCLDLLYKPIVLECGHVSCFWCVHKSMDALHESHCPICRHPYHHFPTICEMLHFLLLKMYPHAYREREKQILVEEKENDCFSPQLDNKEINNNDESKLSYDTNMVSDRGSSSRITSANDDPSKMGRTFERLSTSDVLCSACKQLLHRPTVLNCGHVYCEACMAVPEDGIIICEVCKCPHPSDCPNVCLEFNNFLEERFPKEYTTRRESVKEKQAHSQHKSPSSCSSSKKSAKKGCFTPHRGEDSIPWWNEHSSNVHVAAGCDYCGMYPIVGDRYRCLDCVEKIGFDLCKDCYNTRSKRPGRFNQQHTSDHRFELVKQLDPRTRMLCLVGGHLVDRTGASVLAISAMEDPPDGWIAVDALDNNVVAPSGTPGNTMLYDSDTQDGSIEVEFGDAMEAVINLTSIAQNDHNMNVDGENDPPF